MSLNSFADVKALIDRILTQNGQYSDAKGAPHGNFWATLTYQQFTTGNVPGGITDSNGQPVRILIPGNSGASNLIAALQGTDLFDPNNGIYPQMPADGPPFFTAADIKQIADWIDANCPP